MNSARFAKYVMLYVRQDEKNKLPFPHKLMLLENRAAVFTVEIDIGGMIELYDFTLVCSDEPGPIQIISHDRELN